MTETAVLFRAVNERILHLDGARAGEHDFVCECDDARCTQVMPLTGDQYAAVRMDPDQFAVVSGHERGVDEEIVSENVRHVVVRKRALLASR
jgi:hypothetical protein